MFSEPVDRAVIRLSRGNIDIWARPGEPRLEIDFGGIGGGDVEQRIEDGVLYVDYACGGPELCGGDLSLSLPPQTPVDVWVGTGNLSIQRMASEVLATTGEGVITVSDHGDAPVSVAGSGGMFLSFLAPPSRIEALLDVGAVVLELPAGAYDLALDASGVVTIGAGIIEDPASPHAVEIVAASGGILVHER